MSWKSDKSIERLVKFFKRVPKQVFPEDIQAIKTISETIKHNEINYVNDNLLFAKLLCVMLKCNYVHRQDMKSTIKSINQIFSLSLETHIESLKNEINMGEFNSYLKQIGMNTTIPYDEQEQIDDLNTLSKNEKEVIEKIKSFWTYEHVEKSFYNSANEFLKDTENYI